MQRQSRFAAFAALVLLAGVMRPHAAAAASWSVATSGVDAFPCGTAASLPCRSITRAIALAADGDTIKVGPGLYGDDNNRNGTLNEPGEETSGFSNGIEVGKTLTIVSTQGAASTVIRWAENIGGSVVTIDAPNITFGKLGSGFTLSFREGTSGITVQSGGGGSQVAGNVLVMEPSSDAISSSNGISVYNAAGVSVHDNRIFCWENTADYTHASVGIITLATNVRTDRNSVVGCNLGVEAFSIGAGESASVTRSVAIDGFVGFPLSSTILGFSGNAAYGNSFGLGIESPASATATYSGNTFVGNDALDFGPGNCGIANGSGVAVNAAGNFWGVSTGPGPDPADGVCPGTGSVTTAPFLAADKTKPQSGLR